MLEPIKATAVNGSQDYGVVLIDWCHSGWFPAWVEAVNVLNQQEMKARKLFHLYVSEGFEPFPHRGAVLCAIATKDSTLELSDKAY
jgi:hypothetical protein